MSSINHCPFIHMKIVSQTSRDILAAYRKDLDDLSARLGATTFGRAEDIDMTKFKTLKYVFIHCGSTSFLDAVIRTPRDLSLISSGIFDFSAWAGYSTFTKPGQELLDEVLDVVRCNVE